MRIIAGFSAVFLFIFSTAAQHNSQALLSSDGKLRFRELPTPVELRHQLDSLERYSGMDFYSLVLPSAYSLGEVPPAGNNTHQKTYRLSIDSTAFNLNFQINHEAIDKKDVIFILQGKDTIYNSRNKINKHPYFLALNGRLQIVYQDKRPFNKAHPILTNISLSPTALRAKQADFGDSGPCQVNANCLEENDFPRANSSAARILWRNSGYQGWCSGSLIANSNYDSKPYLLTAEHCALHNGFVSNSDLNHWVFFFNYESAGCDNPPNDNGLQQQTITGADWVARSNDGGGDEGSDFLLLELSREIPPDFQVFFAGWNRSGIPPTSGSCYHHPSSDIKKVSTYYSPAQRGSYGGSVQNTHWLVHWWPTTHGHGTTEKGSSGAALLDKNGLIRGVLTGGASSCTSTDQPDYFGALSYSWTGNGSALQNQLKPWLDPANTGFLSLPGQPAQTEPPAVTVAPNPAKNGVVKVKKIGNYSQPVRLQLFNLAGQMVADHYGAPIPGKGMELHVQKYQPGFYILQFSQAQKMVTIKVMLL